MAAKSEIPLSWTSTQHRSAVRTFRWGVAYELTFTGRRCLLLQESGAATGILYAYDDEAEFWTDRARVLGFGDDLAGAGVPARDRPTPPTLTELAELPL